MDIYSLSRSFWDWSFENPDKVRPNHIAMYFFAVEHCNRLGWKSKFGFPTTMVMDAIGIKSYNTFIKVLNELVEYGFIEMIEKSKNQYSSNIIALSKIDKANDKALDKALMKHVTKQSESTIQSIDSIDIPIYKSTTIQEREMNLPKESEAIEAIPPDTGKGRPLRVSPKETISDSPETDELVKKATDAIASFFNITEIANAASYLEIGRFVHHQANQDKIAFLRTQFSAYKELKSLDGCKHSWRKYIGDPSGKYQNGAWCEKQWDLELSDFKIKQIKHPASTIETPTVLSAPKRANRQAI